MTIARVFSIKIVSDLVGRSKGFRWVVFEGGKERDKSTYPFQTERAAQADAEAYVKKLDSIWEDQQAVSR